MPVSQRPALIRRRLLGAAVLLAAGLLAWGLWQRPNPLAARRTVRADLTDASGLAAVGADVRVAGAAIHAAGAQAGECARRRRRENNNSRPPRVSNPSAMPDSGSAWSCSAISATGLQAARLAA